MFSPSSPSRPLRDRRILKKFGIHLVAHGLAFSGSAGVSVWMRDMNEEEGFGRFFVRGAELSSNFRGRRAPNGSSSVGMACRVGFIIDWRWVPAPRGSRFYRNSKGVFTLSYRGVGIRPINLFLASTRWTSSGGIARARIRCLARMLSYQDTERSDGNSA